MSIEYGLQDQFASNYDKRKLCSYDIEIIDRPTKPLIHQAARFLLFGQGKGVMNINEKAYDLDACTFVAILPWDTSEVTEVSEPLEFVKIIYNYDYVNQFLRINGSAPVAVTSFLADNPVIRLSEEEYRQITVICDAIRDEVGVESFYEVEQEKELSELMIGNKIAELMISYKRMIMKRGVLSSDIRKDETHSKSGIFKYIYAHIADYMTPDKLSKVFNMSQEDISQYIQEMTGYTLSAYINETRISKVCDLLIHTHLPLIDIAMATGFNDASHLIKNFKNRMHVSPNEYRQSYHSDTEVFREDEKTLGFAAVSFINDFYTDDLRSIDVAKHFGTTVIELNRALLFVIEMNFEEFLHYKRINKAAELLLETDMAEIDICMEVGYNNIKTFTRNFVKLKNVRPGDFRRQYTLQQGGESIPVSEEEN